MMNWLVGIFIFASLLSLFLTPLVAEVARRWRILDTPGARKIHQAETPRAGGIAIYVAFMITFLAALVLQAGAHHLMIMDSRIAAFLCGGAVVFALGLWDDVRTLKPAWKLGGQVAAAVIAYAGGLQIAKVALPGSGELIFTWLSLPATVLWFVLIINALNLIDGLDGLAAGIAFFASLVLLIVMELSGRSLVAVGLACLAGAALGFLRYNFHPASIFLGDGGSYFLGYCLAALSIMGSVKSEATVAILIPVVALGVPVMDAVWSPIRRFLLGQRMFHPDRDHIHHRLLKLGYTHRRAVLLLYSITILMGLTSLLLVHTRNNRTALILVLVAAGAIIGIRKLGYFDYLRTEKFVGWLGTVSDELGLRRNRRSFLECQVSISQASGLTELRHAVASAAQFLDLDHCELNIAGCTTCGHERCEFGHSGRRDHAAPVGDPRRTLQVSLPLVRHGMTIGCLSIAQQMNRGPTNPYLLRRIDQLRGTIAETLHRLYIAHLAAGNGGHRRAAVNPGDARPPQRRVLFLTHYFPPEGNAPASRVHALCKHWVRQGEDVTVITCAPNVPDGVVYEGYRNKWYQREDIDGIHTIRVWTYLAANKGTARRILNYLSYMVSAVVAAARMKKPDIVIATSPQFFCGWAGVFVSRLRGVPLILEIRDIWPESIVTVGAMRNRRLVRLLEWLEQRMYAAAGHIVTVGEGYRDRLCDKGVETEKISVISNGVDSDSVAPHVADPRLRERWGLGRRFVCAYVGTIGMACGLDVVLRAAQKLRAKGRTDIAFLVVGDGAVRTELQQEAERCGLDNVVFTGRQDKGLIPDILASVDATLVHLKKRELFTSVMPSKIFEAAAAAKPIILGVQGYAADLVRRAGCGICIEPENENQLVATVEQMADDHRLAADLGHRGHDFFVQHFDRGTLADNYLDLIHRLVADRAGAARGSRDATAPTGAVGLERREPAAAPPAVGSLRGEADLTPPSAIEASH